MVWIINLFKEDKKIRKMRQVQENNKKQKIQSTRRHQKRKGRLQKRKGSKEIKTDPTTEENAIREGANSSLKNIRATQEECVADSLYYIKEKCIQM